MAVSARVSIVRPDPTPTTAAVRSTLEPLVEGEGWAGGPTLVVALSGGLDSVVLLHVLRFQPGFDRRLVAAHFDHAMRPGSRRDAAWVRGLCRSWAVELRSETARAGPTSEDEARTARYEFLRRVAAGHERPILLTAHHADDQAETVLFRALRGTGIEGLAGIPRVRTLDGPGAAPILARPLLDVWREELEAYAAHYGLGWRDDPTNEELGYARNVLRHEILPTAEERVASGARRALVRLARIAGDEDAAWSSAMPLILDAVDARPPPTSATDSSADARPALDDVGPSSTHTRAVSCDRGSLVALGPELVARVLRHLATSVGHTLGADATRRAVAFVRDSQSGRRIELGAGVELELDGDRVVIER